jgi:hypothetical protein
MPKTAALAIVLLMAFAVVAAVQPRDVDGWGKIKWGMTVAQVRAAYGGQAESPDGESRDDKNPDKDKFVDRLIIKKLTVGDTEMNASIASLSGSDRIVRVSLSPTAPLLTVGSGGAAYQDLKTSLTRKYGRPSSVDKEDDDQIIAYSAKWIFPSTEIILSWIEVKQVGHGVLNLIYTSADKKALDVL